MVFNGRVAAAESFPEGCASGSLEADVPAASDGWIAARLWSRARDSFAQPVFAHTSPVYVVTGQAGPEKRAAAAYFGRRHRAVGRVGVVEGQVLHRQPAARGRRPVQGGPAGIQEGARRLAGP